MQIRGNYLKQERNYIIEFSNYLVLGFLRIENLCALLDKSRAYSKYKEIPHILQNYVMAEGDETRQSTLQKNFEEKLQTINMYSFALSKMPEQSRKSGNDIDKLNHIVSTHYGIEENNFFSSTLSNRDITHHALDENINNKIVDFLKKYSELKGRIKSIKNKDTIRDIYVCTMISSAEFTNALHHIYISYYVYANNDAKHKENLDKASKHLERAIFDIDESSDLTDQQEIKHDHIKRRLDKIFNVGKH